MELFRISRNVWGQEILQGMSWDLLPVFFGAGAAFIICHMIYRWLFAPKDEVDDEIMQVLCLLAKINHFKVYNKKYIDLLIKEIIKTNLIEKTSILKYQAMLIFFINKLGYRNIFLDKSLKNIERCQNADGGWSFDKSKSDTFKETDIFALGRINRTKASIYRNKTYEHFRNNKLDKNTVFIVNNKNHLRNLKFLLKESNNGFFFRDNMWILIPNYKTKMNKNDRNEFDKIDFVEIFPGKEKKLQINDEESVIGLGWTHNLNRSGMWTEGNEANIIFKLKNYEPKDHILRFKIKSVMTNNTDKLNMHLIVDGEFVKKLTFDRFTNQDNKFIDIILKKEDLENEFHKIDFKIENPISPVSILESPDGRRLGMLVESIIIN